MGDQSHSNRGAGPTRKLLGERLQITALFYDMVDSTALLSRIDPEDFGLLHQEVHAAAAEIVEACGGTLDQIVGDGGCAYFGYPEASEDAAQSAVEAALRIVERCRRMETPAHGEQLLGVRVGVATGTVVVRTPVTSRLSDKSEVIGLAPNLAARLQAIAWPNTVFVAATTHALTRSLFEFRPVGSIEIKGFGEPQHVWQASARRDVNIRLDARRRPNEPLLGRQAEIAVCRRPLADALAGRGGVLWVTGEAGIGKSRLVAELSSQHAGSAAVHVFQCQPRGALRLLHPILDRIGRETETASVPISPARCGAPSDSLRVLSYLVEPRPARDPVHRALSEMSGEEVRRAAVDAAIEILSAWARAGPQLVVLEDQQWADPLTRDLLRRMAADVPGLPVLLIVTSRDAPPPELAGSATVIDLQRLDVETVSELVGAIWNPLPVPEGMAALIEERSEGVPLFVEELASLLREQFGAAAGNRADWEAVLKRDGVVTLNDLLAARIANLGAARTVVQVASVIGKDFDYGLLEEILRGAADSFLAEHLDTLLENRVIGRADGRQFRFRHVLLQEAAYESLLKTERRDLHGRIVEAVRDTPRWRLPDAVMAWHCEQAGLLREAAQYAVKAAERCAVGSAVHEAERLLAAADGYLSQLGESAELEELTLHMLATRGPVAMALFGDASREAGAIYERAIALCSRVDPKDRERWFSLYWGWWMTAPTADSMLRARSITAELDATADPEVRLQALHCSWATHFHAGNHAECTQCIEAGLRFYDPERAILSRTRYGGHDARVCALSERAQSLWLTGDSAAAVAEARAALEWADEIGHVGSICHALDGALIVNHFERDFDAVMGLASRLRALAEKHALPGSRAKSDIFAGWASALTSGGATGRDVFERGLRHHREVGTEEDLPLYLMMRSELLAEAGEPIEAATGVLEAIDIAVECHNAVWLPELYRYRAALRRADDPDSEGAGSDLEQALRLAHAHGAHAVTRRIESDINRTDLRSRQI